MTIYKFSNLSETSENNNVEQTLRNEEKMFLYYTYE